MGRQFQIFRQIFCKIWKIVVKFQIGIPDCLKMRSDFFSRVRWNRHIPCVQCERETAYFESMPSAHAQTFSSLGSNSLYYSYYPYDFLSLRVLLSIFLFRNVFSKIFRDFFFITFYSKIFVQNFLQIFFVTKTPFF